MKEIFKDFDIFQNFIYSLEKTIKKGIKITKEVFYKY